MVWVFRTGDHSAVDTAELATQYVEEARARQPEGVTLTAWQNDAESLNNQLSLMLRNGFAGFALVFLVLVLFLELSPAYWVSLGIPISFFAVIALMPGFDVSVNVLTLFGFVLVLGIVVDDAILVGENIYRHQEEHGDRMRGSIDGAYEIAKPVTFVVLTAIAALSTRRGLAAPGPTGQSAVCRWSRSPCRADLLTCCAWSTSAWMPAPSGAPSSNFRPLPSSRL